MANLTAVKNNIKVVSVDLSEFSGITGCTFIVSLKEFYSSEIFNVIGVLSGSSVTFNISATQNNIDERVYFYAVRAYPDNNNIANGGYNIVSEADAILEDYLENIVDGDAPTYYYNKTQINSYTGQTETTLETLQSEIDFLGQIQTQALTYIFEHPAADIAGYEKLSPSITTLTGVTETVTVNGTQLIDSYITPPLGISTISSGIWFFHFHASANVANNANMRFDVYKYNGTETLLFQSALFPIISTSITEYQFSNSQPQFTGFTATDRIVVKAYAVNTANRTVNWYYSSSNYNAYVTTPIRNINQLGTISQYNLWTGSTAQYSGATKNNNTIYFVV